MPKSPIATGFSAGFYSPPVLSLSQWANEYAYLSPESSAEPGKWRSYPYQVGIMDAITDPAIWRISLMKCARLGYTKILNHVIGYHVHYDPCSILMVQPTVEDAQGHSKDEIAPMLRDTRCLHGLVSDPKAKISDNTILKKVYPGGSLILTGANSPRGFRRITVRIALFDEVDGYPASAGKEGDQIKLGIMRTDTFWNRKVVDGSTPTVKGASKIDTSFNESDKRYRFLPCPRCGHMQYLVWSQIKWPPDNPERAYYECPNCLAEIDHRQKKEMDFRGEWRPTAEATGHAGFHIWAAYSYSPNATWGHLATEFMEATAAYRNGHDPEKFKLQTFVNTRLAETWEAVGDRVDAITISARGEHYKDEAPAGVLIINAGVDVQGDRLELEVVGWGLGFESWSLDYLTIDADDPADQNDKCWTALAEQLDRTWERPDGSKLHMACMGLDTGYATDAASAFAKKHSRRRVYAMMGSETPGRPLVTAAGKTRRRGALGFVLYHIGTEAAKQSIYARLKVEGHGPGFCHFPADRDEHYFDMLTAEEMKIRYKRGVPYKVFEMKPGKKRNEALDCRVYAYCALMILNPKWAKIKAKAEPKEPAGETEEQPQQPVENEPIKPAGKRKRAKRKGGWVNRWKR